MPDSRRGSISTERFCLLISAEPGERVRKWILRQGKRNAKFIKMGALSIEVCYLNKLVFKNLLGYLKDKTEYFLGCQNC